MISRIFLHMWKKSTLNFMKVIQTQIEVCRCIFHAICGQIDLNWFDVDFVLSVAAWMQLNFLRKWGRKCLSLWNIVKYCYCIFWFSVLVKPPYEVTETGWGEFEVVIKIYFNDPNERPVRFLLVLFFFVFVVFHMQ